MGGDSFSDHAKRAARMGVKSFQRAAKRKRKPPAELVYLLGWYNEIRGQQSRGMFVEPISFTEIAAYRDLMELELDAFDAWVLCKLDRVWLSCVPPPDSGKQDNS